MQKSPKGPLSTASHGSIVTIQIVDDGSFLLSNDNTDSASAEEVRVASGNVAFIRMAIASMLSNAQIPAVVVKANATVPFRPLAEVLIALDHEYVSNLQIVIGANHSKLSVSLGWPTNSIASMRIGVRRQGDFLVAINEREPGAEPSKRIIHDARALADAISQMKAKRGNFDISIACAQDASVQSFFDAVAAIQSNAISKYLIEVGSSYNQNKSISGTTREQVERDFETMRKIASLKEQQRLFLESAD